MFLQNKLCIYLKIIFYLINLNKKYIKPIAVTTLAILVFFELGTLYPISQG